MLITVTTLALKSGRKFIQKNCGYLMQVQNLLWLWFVSYDVCHGFIIFFNGFQAMLSFWAGFNALGEV